MSAYPNHRIRTEVIWRNGWSNVYGWYCTICDECSEYFPSRFAAWRKSLYYRRYGICRPIPSTERTGATE